MSFDPTQTQALLLFGLLARHGECAQGELMPAIAAKDREALVAAKLIGVEKVGRSFRLALTDAGWGWANGHLAAELPPAHGTLHDLLMRLGDHLAKAGETVADFIGSKPEDPAAAARSKAAEEKQQAAEEKERLGREKREAAAARKRAAEEKKQRTAREKAEKAEAKIARSSAKRDVAPRPRPPTHAALRERIEMAYLKLTAGRKDESLSLTLLRTELTDLDRTTLDGALGRILQGDALGRKRASLMRNDDPRRLDQADRDAAFNPNGEPFHLIWIAS